MTSKKHILFVDDDETYLGHLQSAFSPHYQVSLATTIARAEQILASVQIDVIILDYQFDGENGHALIDKLQTGSERPAIIVVSGCFDADMAKGFLKRQIQNFFEKPLVIEELHTAINTITCAENANQEFVVSPTTRKVIYAGREVLLTPMEYEILNYFLLRPSQQVVRSEIIQQLWGQRIVSRNAFDTHLLNLKKKLPPFAAKLFSIYGTGYCYEA